MHYFAQSGPTLTDRFGWLLGGLCHYLGAVLGRDRSRGPLTVLIHGRLERRFAALVAWVAAETLRPPRVRAAALGAAGGLRLAGPADAGAPSLCGPPEAADAAGRRDAGVAGGGAANRAAVLWMMGRPVPDALRVPRMGPPRPRKPRPSRAIVIPDFAYIEQPYKSRHPRSVWPSKADLIRTARRMVRDERRVAREERLKSRGK